jgi:hypothetical protein
MLYGDAVINFHILMDAHALYGLGDSASRTAELNSGTDHVLLSMIQVHIFASRSSDPFLWTYARIRKEYHITRDEAVHHDSRWSRKPRECHRVDHLLSLQC